MARHWQKKERDEHQKVKEQLFKFQKLSPDSPEFIPTLSALFTDLQAHMRDEEAEVLVQLEDALHPDESDRLAKSFDRTKKFVPTRSHPSAPNKPPFETVVGLLSAPLDKLMDAFRKFPEE